ncbi:hypothetical protein T440DRAFT_485864 [Plenodomus tracheiphilus IPT5]|uniref:F-box domain-containing protein n=1 Tax=Plenodomus tracheiphilus IPT5 TaxID=1408161 RepID=A0A6A7BMJ9_9PLEO|nr:hypothetical protein T440DRAFT_485864 [Plenodomus tracheiphilus IPT5]
MCNIMADSRPPTPDAKDDGKHSEALSTCQEGSTRAYTSHLCFASLPAELRNDVYAQTLGVDRSLSLTYDVASQQFSSQGQTGIAGRTPLEALVVLSSIDHYTRHEARSFFFARNNFEIKTRQTLEDDPDYVEVYIKFLENIGDIGRGSLSNLRLIVTGDSKRHRPNNAKAIKLFEFLASCTNLKRLDLFLDVDYFYMNQRKGLDSYLTTHGSPISNPWSKLSDSLKLLKNLSNLKLHVVFSSRWRSVDIQVHNTWLSDGASEPHTFHDIRFQVNRPREEAEALTDQVKGSVRAALRPRNIRINVVATETWTKYGPDLILTRRPRENKSSDWRLVAWVKNQNQKRDLMYYENGEMVEF